MKYWMIKFVTTGLFLAPVCAMAGWEVTRAETTAPRGPFYQPVVSSAPSQQPTACNNAAAVEKKYEVPGQRMYAVNTRTTSQTIPATRTCANKTLPKQYPVPGEFKTRPVAKPVYVKSSPEKIDRKVVPMAYRRLMASRRMATQISGAFPNQTLPGQAGAIYAVSISGSLKENIERIMGRYHWKVIWKAPYDYNFDGRITGSSLPNVVEKLLQPFPLQAVMYMSNRTITIVPRLKA